MCPLLSLVSVTIDNTIGDALAIPLKRLIFNYVAEQRASKIGHMELVEKKEKGGFQIVHPNAAGIDIASQMNYVAVPP